MGSPPTIWLEQKARRWKDSSSGVSRVISRTDQVHRHVGLVTNDPAVVSTRDVEEIAGAELEHAAVIHRRRGTPTDHDSDVLGPFPTWLVPRAPDGQSADMHEF